MLTQTTIRAHPNKYWYSCIALLAIPLSGLCIDINVPSLPAVSHYYHMDKSLAQLTITAYMLGLGTFQLVAGSLSDSLGRKKPFIIAMLLFILANLLIPCTTTIYQLLGLRFLQGALLACISVPMRAVIADLHQGKELSKMVNYMNMAWAIGPIAAPAIGGYLQEYFGWHAPFYFLAIYAGLLLLLNLSFMPETLYEKQPLNLKLNLKNYHSMLINPEYLRGLLCLGSLYSLLVLFGIVGPFLIQTVLHYSAIAFGHMALLMGIAWFLGTMTNRCLLNIEPQAKIKSCFWLMLAGAIIMLIFAIITPLHIYAIILPTFYLLYVAAIAFPNYYASSMALFPKISASANALMGTFMVWIAGAISAIGALLKSNNQLPLALMYIALSVICLEAYYYRKPRAAS